MKSLLPPLASLALLASTGCSNRSKPPPTTTQVDPESVRKAQDERRFRDQEYLDMCEGRNGM
jgi:hypothetical protein